MCSGSVKSLEFAGSFRSDRHSGFKEPFHLESFFTRNERYIIDCLSKGVETRILVPFYNYLKVKHGDKLDQWLEQNGLKEYFGTKLAKEIDTTSQLMIQSKETKDQLIADRRHKIQKVKPGNSRLIPAKSPEVSEGTDVSQSKSSKQMGEGKNLLDFLTGSNESYTKQKQAPVIPLNQPFIPAQDPRLLSAGSGKMHYPPDLGHIRQPVYNAPPSYNPHIYPSYSQYQYPANEMYYHRPSHAPGNAWIPSTQIAPNPSQYYDPHQYHSLSYNLHHPIEPKVSMKSPTNESKNPIINFIPLSPITKVDRQQPETRIMDSVSERQPIRSFEVQSTQASTEKPQLWDMLTSTTPELPQPAQKSPENPKAKIEDMFSKIFQNK